MAIKLTSNDKPIKVNTTFIQILVFKIKLRSAIHVGAIGSSLNTRPNVYKWNVYLHDCDNILRVVANNINAKEVEIILIIAGYYCEALE